MIDSIDCAESPYLVSYFVVVSTLVDIIITAIISITISGANIPSNIFDKILFFKT